MIVTFLKNNRQFNFNVENPLDISIPLNFNGDQPNIYDVENAVSTAYEGGNFIGDTRRGGSCNFENIAVNPHCNGTHTECVGHITFDRISVNDCLKDSFLLANMITVSPENASESDETYAVKLDKTDKLITRKALETGKWKPENGEALIIRTNLNDSSKMSRDYSTNNPPFFSTEAMQYIVELGVKHLLVDVPSLEKLHDEGKLSNHRLFWNVEQGSNSITPQTKVNNTVTEMIYVPDEIADGVYLLNLQIAPFVSDASPSRPILFKMI